MIQRRSGCGPGCASSTGTGDADDYRATFLRPTRYLSSETLAFLFNGDPEEQLREGMANPPRSRGRNPKQNNSLILDAFAAYLATLEGARAVGPAPSPMLAALRLEACIDAESKEDKSRQTRRMTDPAVMVRVVTRLAASAANIDESRRGSMTRKTQTSRRPKSSRATTSLRRRTRSAHHDPQGQGARVAVRRRSRPEQLDAGPARGHR